MPDDLSIRNCLTVGLVGDGAGSGEMTIEKLSKMLRFITENMDVVGFTAAEYDIHRMRGK